jgi:deoxyribose-phosphate aldolase
MDFLTKYGYAPNPEAMSRALDLIAANLDQVASEQVYKDCFSMMDLTTLKTDDTPASVTKLVNKVNAFQQSYPEWPLPASICVYPNFASVVSESLEADNVKTCCVAGGFPSSQTFTEVKIAETSLALLDGAEEIDIVQNVGKFLNGDYEYICSETEELKEICKEKTLKVIIECGALQNLENVKKASILAMYSGADFIKTSTGKEVAGADPKSFFVMCKAIKEYYDETGKKIGIKAAGGISTTQDALLYYSIVNNVLGKEWLNNKLFRIGASRLFDNLLESLISSC